MPTNFQQENMGNPTPARLSLGFPYQQGLWSPNFGHTTNALLGSVAVVPTARPGADVEWNPGPWGGQPKQKNCQCSVQKPIQESDKHSLVKCDQHNVS